jgi:hypothetical protein
MPANKDPYANPGFGIRLKKFISALGSVFRDDPHMVQIWSSSARDLDLALEKNGVDIGKKLFHKYNMPENADQGSYLAWFDRFCRKFGLRRKNRNLYEERVEQIKKLNPGLSEINPKNVRDMVGFIYGVIFGFSPEEINYFISELMTTDRKNKEAQMLRDAQLRLIREKTGKRVGLVLSPENLELIANTIKNQRK